MFQPLEKMTEAQLRWRIDWHVNFAEMFRSKNETGMAREFIELANIYADELERRGLPVDAVIASQRRVSLITQADFDRLKAKPGIPIQ